MEFKKAFENERFLAVDKPAAMLTIPGRAGDADARLCLSTELQRELNVRIWTVHRLDYEVSGLVLFAKDAETHRAASLWFESRAIHKTYEAWSEGRADLAEKFQQPTELQSRLLRGKRRTYASPHGKHAITQVLCTGATRFHEIDLLTWKLDPRTGRSHQLRFELSNRGFPILGDVLYGAKQTLKDGVIALRAVRLDFGQCQEARGFGLPEAISIEGIAETFDAAVA